MKEETTYKSLQKFINNKYSYKDYMKVKQWFEDLNKRTDFNDGLYNHWESMIEKDFESTGNFKALYAKVEYQILLAEKQQSEKKRYLRLYQQIAAVLLVPILITSILLMSLNRQDERTGNLVEIYSPMGARTAFQLPDGSHGWLNSGSKLSYDPTFSQNREVTLDGEAYFDVKHDDNKQFVVHADQMDITVLGTQFNVSSYDEESTTEVVLVEGKVQVNGTQANFQQTLSPRELISYNSESKKLIKEKVDIMPYVAWKDGLLVLNNEPLYEAAHQLEKWYNVEMVIVDEVLKNYRFKATFEDEALEEVLKLMAFSTPIDYRIEHRKKDGKGLYKKKKVTLRLRK